MEPVDLHMDLSSVRKSHGNIVFESKKRSGARTDPHQIVGSWWAQAERFCTDTLKHRKAIDVLKCRVPGRS